jgi:hypothetical protein
MKQAKAITFVLAIFGFTLIFLSCDKEEPNGVVTFSSGNISITTDDLSPVTFSLSIEPPAPITSSITIDVTAAGGDAGVEFVTDPPTRSGEIDLAVAQGDTNATFTVTLQKENIAYDNLTIAFEIFTVGEGLETSGIVGLTSSLFMENLKEEPTSSLPFIEYFDLCDGGGGGGTLPAEWEEKILTQNSKGTAHWVCAPGFDGVECNAFTAAGEEGDASEAWLITPIIDLSGTSNPELTFSTDRRFETADFLEYDVKISTNYDRTNFAAATWTTLPSAVSAIEANDPELDNYEIVSGIDLSAYIDQQVSIAFIYYAEGSKFTATIFRIDDVEINEVK